MKYKMTALCFSALFLSGLASAAEKAPIPAETSLGRASALKLPVDDRQQAEKLLANIFEVYRHYSRDTFCALVSEKFAPGRVEFINAVEQGYHAGAVLELNYVIDKALPTGNKLAVVFKWEKKTQPASLDHPIMRKGSVQFMFERVKDQWLLVQVAGTSPF